MNDVGDGNGGDGDNGDDVGDDGGDDHQEGCDGPKDSQVEQKIGEPQVQNPG